MNEDGYYEVMDRSKGLGASATPPDLIDHWRTIFAHFKRPGDRGFHRSAEERHRQDPKARAPRAGAGAVIVGSQCRNGGLVIQRLALLALRPGRLAI